VWPGAHAQRGVRKANRGKPASSEERPETTGDSIRFVPPRGYISNGEERDVVFELNFESD
jgi:hypothetical protein